MAQSFLTNDLLWSSLPTIWKGYLGSVKALIYFLTIFLVFYGAEDCTANNHSLLYFHTVCLAKILWQYVQLRSWKQRFSLHQQVQKLFCNYLLHICYLLIKSGDLSLNSYENIKNLIMQRHVGYTRQTIISIGVKISFIVSSSYFPNFWSMFPTNNIQQVSTDTPQVYGDLVLFMLMVQDNCDRDICPFG